MWDVISVVEKPQIHMLQAPQLTQPWEYLSQTL